MEARAKLALHVQDINEDWTDSFSMCEDYLKALIVEANHLKGGSFQEMREAHEELRLLHIAHDVYLRLLRKDYMEEAAIFADEVLLLGGVDRDVVHLQIRRYLDLLEGN